MSNTANDLKPIVEPQSKPAEAKTELAHWQDMLRTIQGGRQSEAACYRRVKRAMSACCKGRVLLNKVSNRGKKNESFRMVVWTQDAELGLLFIDCSVSREDPCSGRLKPVLLINPAALETLLQLYKASSFKELVEQRQGLVCALAWEVLFINRKISRPDNEFSFLTRQAELLAAINPCGDCITITEVVSFESMSPAAAGRRKKCLRYDWLLSVASREGEGRGHHD